MKITPIWYSKDVDLWKAVKFADYRQSAATGRRFGFVREIFYTKVIDISKEERELFSMLPVQTRRMIRQAHREEIAFGEGGDITTFTDFFNTFSRQKNLAFRLMPEFLEKFRDSLLITAATKGREVLVMHTHLCHPDTGRARMLYGASVLRAPNKTVSKTLIGSANRALHFHDMCTLRRKGFRLYDMGGYAFGTNDPELEGINRFKDQFGGTLVREANYRSIPLHVASVLYDKLASTLKGTPLAGIFHSGSPPAAQGDEAAPRRSRTP